MIIQPQNIQPPLRVQESSVRPDSRCQPARRRSSQTGEEDEDFEEKSKDGDAAPLLADLEQIKKERAEDQARRTENKRLKKEGFIWKTF